MGRHRAQTGRSGTEHRAHDDHDGCAIGIIVISIAMLVFAGCTLVSARAAAVVAAVVAAVSLLVVATWVRRYVAGRTGL